MRGFLIGLLLCGTAFGDFSQTYRYLVVEQGEELTWECPSCLVFDELLLSWRGERPERGRYSFLVSLKQNGTWSDWLYFAEWRDFGQVLFHDLSSFAKTEFGNAHPLGGVCDGFKVRVLGSGGAIMARLKELSVCVSYLPNLPSAPEEYTGEAVLLEGVPQLSQLALNHERSWDLSLPTAMSSAIGFLTERIHPVEFAERVCDDDNGFYESWIFNCAEANRCLGNKGVAHVERLANFQAIYQELLKKRPVVIGMKGYIPGGPRPYYFEHSLCIIGFDPASKKVHCMDPGFANPRATFVSYPLDALLNAWKKRNHIACLFGDGF